MNQSVRGPGIIAAVSGRSATTSLWLPADAMIGLLSRGVRTGTRFGARLTGTLRPLIDLAARPPMVPPRYWPGPLVARLAAEGRDQRRRATAAALDLFHRLVCVEPDTTSEPDRDQAAERVADVPTDPAISEWVERVFHHGGPSQPGTRREPATASCVDE